MGILQDTYTEKQPIGFPGMPANSEPRNVLTRTSETVAGIKFGVPVARGAADLGCIASTATGDKVLGISMIDKSLAPTKGDLYTKGSNTAVMHKGAIWVTVAVAVAPGDPVYFDFATQKFTNLAAAGANLVMPNWVFDLSAAVNGVSIAVRR